jgi:two-component system, chemotaxis family, chemotaxis protein CheY
MQETARRDHGISVDGTAQPGRPRLLVIDDDKLHRMIICRAGAKAGYAPAGAATYKEAIRLLRDAAYDCVSLEPSLGSHTGIEILHQLRNLGHKSAILIISRCAGAACAETARLAESLNLTIMEMIAKPVDLAVLTSALERIKAEREAAAVAA